ncbi:hypothetical protein GP486_003261 [Trichoglossum hirsutum]|uniref:Peptidase A1 domain-containing protein n=1 Tax=Trichoglossum hirsutum TaxID=265104 RepID=A0A9P8RQX7_9PEZI|nr:hypothetical protein GP486_003261 [Trichoglossum hirsutum]
MASNQTIRLLLIFFLAFSAAANNCSTKPLTLPIGNVTLGNGVAVNRGVYVKLGNQVTSLRLTTNLNNTGVRNALDCDLLNSTARTVCLGASGSIYAPESSNTWRQVSPDEFASNVSTIDTHAVGETVIVGYETAKFSSNVEVKGYPLEVWSNLTSTNRSGLAIGSGSSFLQKLLSVSAAPSRAFGLFYGSRSQSRPTDGALTIGGIDLARLKGRWSNHSAGMQGLDYSCPLQVRIKDIRLNNTKGSFSLLADPQLTVPACIDPQQNAFTFTQAIYNLWSNFTGHPANGSLPGEPPFTSQTYPKDREPLIGTLTVTLDDGFETIIPHYELLSEERGNDAQGRYAVVNASRVMAAVSNDETLPVPILGGVYLSQNYLFVDYDKGTFHLATADLDTHDQDIVPICEGGATPSPSHGSRRLSGRKIAGIAVGVAAVVLIALALALWWARYRTRQDGAPRDGTSQKETPQNGTSQNGTSRDEASQGGTHKDAELEPNERRQELPTSAPS